MSEAATELASTASTAASLTEGWGRERPPGDPADDVLAVKLEASRRDPYRQLSRLFHLVGKRMYRRPKRSCTTGT